MQALPKKNPAQLLLSYLHTVPNKAEVIVMFDKELFYSLCENYKVELSRDYNCPMDKTSFIQEWWDYGDKVTLIARPRRFGKTLMLSTTEAFFSVRYAGKGSLFEGLV